MEKDFPILLGDHRRQLQQSRLELALCLNRGFYFEHGGAFRFRCYVTFIPGHPKEAARHRYPAAH
jgi:hypothetical protein